jgi:Sec-independent protein secretion pathway component TatC
VSVIAAMLTPPHAVFQTGMAVPMYLRYEGGILFACLMARSNDNKGKNRKGTIHEQPC